MSSYYNVHRRQGLQVVKLSQEPGKRYEVDEGALAYVLLRPEVRYLPVVVVSVAGAYRGGKSFILDFFLRYLRAPRMYQLSGEWLGREDDVLDGFDWRGGAEANTKGIHIWPEPIIVNIESTGQKVAIVLMDTQGTFDSESDMGDNSTIFALSTLLSSVQIYNLRANIGEDDLQHLQLFTEYGKLASDSEGKAFQTLQFLVRDWMSPYDYPHGFAGGQSLLSRRLEPVAGQRRQLVDVREHIRSCFEKLECFLMPHPGLAVADIRFRGRLCDITEQFRLSLLELVPSLFDPENLTPKTINGDQVQAQSLLEYFKQYVDIFNSDDLPEATTIFQATSEAFIMNALRLARQSYENMMNDEIKGDQSVSASMLVEWHNQAVQISIEVFKGKKKLGPQEKIQSHLEELQQDLEDRLSRYMWQNDAKVRDIIVLAKTAYDERVLGVCEVISRLCLHEKDLSALQKAAMDDALNILDNTRKGVPKDQDEERNKLIEHFSQQYQQMYGVNEQNNRSAMLEAREKYTTHMKSIMNQTGFSTEKLQQHHDQGVTAAVKHFHSLRNKPTEEAEDSYVDRLEMDLVGSFMDVERLNTSNNHWAIEMAVSAYNNYVSSAWGSPSTCFHPIALTEMHNAAEEYAIQFFLQDRGESVVDDFYNKLVAKLHERHLQLQETNTFSNVMAIEQALNEYKRYMDWHSQATPADIFLIPFIVRRVKIPAHHFTAKSKAMYVFHNRRKGTAYDEDTYVDDLTAKINQARRQY